MKITDRRMLEWLLRPGICLEGYGGKVLWTIEDVQEAMLKEASTRWREK